MENSCFLLEKPLCTFPIHIIMILLVLGLNTHGFVFLIFPPKGFIQIGYNPYLYTHKSFNSYMIWDIVRL